MSDWFVRAGRSAENFDRFKKEGIIAVDYGEKAHFDLSGMSQDEINAKLPAGDNNGEQLYGISMIKRGDMIAVTGGSNYGNSVKEFGIVTSDYFYSGNEPDNWHRVKLEYLDFGTDEFGQNNQKGVMRDKSGRIAAYFASQNVNDPNQEYFLLRYNGEDRDSPVEEQWKQDKLGERYHFGKTVGNHKKLRKAGVGTKTIWFKTKNLPARYFWGYGSVKEVKTIQEDKEWNVVYDDFKYFEEHEDSVQEEGVFLKRENESIKQQIENLPGFSSQMSMLKITKKIYEEITGDRSTMSAPPTENLALKDYSKTLENDLNLLFYGPPGTGKTYHAKNLAEEFTFKQKQDFEKVIPEVRYQPDFVDSMSDDEYKEFVINSIKKESEKRKFTWLNNTYGQYSIEKNEKRIHLVIHYSASTTQDPDDAYVGISEDNVSFFNQVPIDNRFIVMVNHSHKNFVVLPYSIEQNHAKFSASSAGNWDPSGKNAHSFHVEIKKDECKFKGTNYDCKNFIRNVGIIFGQFIRTVTFHPSYSYEEFVEGIRPNLDSDQISYKLEHGIFKDISKQAELDPDNRYVLLIDEINRGNIPKIFGELITLIEDEKREVYSLNLTYSKELFTVPKNLYIIGTMNTADQSISHLDTALRRRFSHEELMPKGDLVDNTIDHNGKKINLKDVLNNINAKIRKDAGRERQIGHSYFMKDDEPLSEIVLLRDRFKSKIIPLIQDYFYEDMNKVHKILGEGFIDKTEETVKEKTLDDLDAFADAVNAI